MAKEIFFRQAGHDELVVILHGLGKSPQALQGVISAAKAARPNADILVPGLPIGGWFGMLSHTPSARIAANVVERIEWAIEQRGGVPYAQIVLAGHSFGGVLARKVAIIAYGEQAAAPFEPQIDPKFKTPRSWAGAIERLVLLASMSRGWLPESTRTWLEQVKWSLGSWAAEFLAVVRYNLTVMDIRRGMPFIVQTRLQWLTLAAKDGPVAGTRERWRLSLPQPPAGATKEVLVLQLLGTIDDVVSPNDSVDLSVDTANNAPFKLIELPLTNHEHAIVMKKPTPAQQKILTAAITQSRLSDDCKEKDLAAEARWLLLKRALFEPLASLKDIAIDPELFADTPAITPRPDTRYFVFVIHGIRDHGFWTQKIARAIKREGKVSNKYFLSFTGSYGYFAMVPFLLRWVRKWKAAWLMDQYVEVKAQFPDAEFSFVGHSNGTYLLASVLQDYPAAKFGRVVFAGSVVRRDFDWGTYLEAPSPRVTEVLNYVATRDWVVAIFPKGFQILKWIFDLGSAGHDGFDAYREQTPGLSGFLSKLYRKPKVRPGVRLREARCIVGTHSAGIAETQWDDIARFVVSGEMPRQPCVDFASRRTWPLVGLGWVSSLILLFGIWIIVGTGISLFRSITGAGTLTVADLVPHPLQYGLWVADTAAGVYAGLVYAVTHLPDVACATAKSMISGAARLPHIGYVALQWVGRAAAGSITTFPNLAQPIAPGQVAGRGIVFLGYVWIVYLFVSRF